MKKKELPIGWRKAHKDGFYQINFKKQIFSSSNLKSYLEFSPASNVLSMYFYYRTEQPVNIVIAKHILPHNIYSILGNNGFSVFKQTDSHKNGYVQELQVYCKCKTFPSTEDVNAIEKNLLSISDFEINNKKQS